MYYIHATYAGLAFFCFLFCLNDFGRCYRLRVTSEDNVSNHQTLASALVARSKKTSRNDVRQGIVANGGSSRTKQNGSDEGGYRYIDVVLMRKLGTTATSKDRKQTLSSTEPVFSWISLLPVAEQLFERPNHGGTADVVQYHIELIKFLGIDLFAESWQGNFKMSFCWSDARAKALAKNASFKTIPVEEAMTFMWVPSIVLANQIQGPYDNIGTITITRQEGNACGDFLMVQWMTITLRTVLDLALFPFDAQSLNLRLAPVVSMDQVVLVESAENSSVSETAFSKGSMFSYVQFVDVELANTQAAMNTDITNPQLRSVVLFKVIVQPDAFGFVATTMIPQYMLVFSLFFVFPKTSTNSAARVAIYHVAYLIWFMFMQIRRTVFPGSCLYVNLHEESILLMIVLIVLFNTIIEKLHSSQVNQDVLNLAHTVAAVSLFVVIAFTHAVKYVALSGTTTIEKLAWFQRIGILGIALVFAGVAYVQKTK